MGFEHIIINTLNVRMYCALSVQPMFMYCYYRHTKPKSSESSNRNMCNSIWDFCTPDGLLWGFESDMAFEICLHKV